MEATAMTSKDSSKAEPPTPPDSDLLTPEEFKALQQQKREMNRRIKEAWAQLRASRTTKLDAYLAKKKAAASKR
jgi:hypothetical protein